MESLKKYEPLWGSWYFDSLIGEGSFGKVYRIQREEFGKTYDAALKAIAIPQNKSEIQHLKSEGLDESSVYAFFQALLTDITQEIDFISQLSGHSHIVSFEDHRVIERGDEFGWDILIRMELLKSLSDHMVEQPLAQEEVLKLGIHICRALELCTQKNIIHRDIKPENIFISRHGEYKLGDFGIARHIERTMSGLSKKGTYTYMAPEVFKGEKYGLNVDIYGLGILIYSLLNRRRAPFLPQAPQSILPDDRDNALQRRMGGEAVPALQNVSPELNDLMQKACAFDRHKRFSHPQEMREQLEVLAGLRQAAERPVSLPVPASLPVPVSAPISAQPAVLPLPYSAPDEIGATVGLSSQEPAASLIPDPIPSGSEAELRPAAEEALPPTDSSEQPEQPEPEKSKKKALLITGLSAIAATVIIGIGLTLFLSSMWHGDKLPQSTVTTTIQATPADPAAVKYKISYDYETNGGTSVQSKKPETPKTTDTTKPTDPTEETETTEAAQGESVDLTPEASKEDGWEFVGWNTDKDAATGLDSFSMPESDVTLYAIYEKTLTATFQDYNGTTPTTIPVSVTIYNNETGGEIMVPAQSTYTGWTARGWGQATAPKADIIAVYGTNMTINTEITFYGLYQRTVTLSYYDHSSDPGVISASPSPVRQTGTTYVNSYSTSVYEDASFVVGDTIYITKENPNPNPFNLPFRSTGWVLSTDQNGKLYGSGDTISIHTDTTLVAHFAER